MFSAFQYCAWNLKDSLKDDKYGWVFFPMGPKAKDYVNYIGDMNAMCFPRSAKHPKEVGKLITELWGPHKWDLDRRASYETTLCDEESVETSFEMEKKYAFSPMSTVNGFCQKVFTSGYVGFVTGKVSANAYIQSIKAAAQNEIDTIWGQSGS